MFQFHDSELNADEMGDDMYRLIEKLYPICRSITGDGVRETLRIIGEYIPLELHEVPTGTNVFDWEVPKEWNIRNAYVKNARGEKVIDFRDSNLHVVSYSIPIHERMPFSELKKHLFVHPENDAWIPYRTSYYTRSWGFCLSSRQLAELADEEYEVLIDSSLDDGSLTYGEYFKRGRRQDEILLSCHVCHPSMCNDNLSGIALVTYLAKLLEEQTTEYSYRILLIPSTIGAITWLAANEAAIHQIRHGLVVSCVGDPGPFQYKRSRRGNAVIDDIAEYVLSTSGCDFSVTPFMPYGYDERQYCSPGFNLPVGRLTRSSNGEYAEYHSSADDLSLVSPLALNEAMQIYRRIIGVVELDRVYVNQNQNCEPQLGKRGLYNTVAGNINELELAMLWILNKSDGESSLLDIAQESGIGFEILVRASKKLFNHGLLLEKE